MPNGVALFNRMGSQHKELLGRFDRNKTYVFSLIIITSPATCFTAVYFPDEKGTVVYFIIYQVMKYRKILIQ